MAQLEASIPCLMEMMKEAFLPKVNWSQVEAYAQRKETLLSSYGILYTNF